MAVSTTDPEARMSANDSTQMSALAQASSAAHPVPDRGHVNNYLEDTELQQLLALYLPADLCAHLQPYFERMGELAGGAVDDWALEADRNPPTLEMRSRSGKEVQRIVKHPAYVEMEKVAYQQFGLAAISHREDMLGWKGKMPAIVKYALTYLFVQSEFGLCCPLSMTDSLTRTLKKYGEQKLVDKYLPTLLAMDFDSAVQGSMFMTEQAAGSDISNTLTMAYPQEDGSWRLYGEKWFCSNPDAGFGMVLARVEGGPPGMKGISLFLLPRTLDDGSTNHYTIVRLKDKMGTRSMASGEIRMEGAVAYLVGEQGRGFVQIADMVNNSRLSNGMRSAGMMRRAVAEAEFIARERWAFKHRLQDLPLMHVQLDKLRVPAEQARTMVFQTAQTLTRSDAGDKTAYALLRILTPLIKFRACRDARKVTGDAMEVRGGCGYIEEWADPRLVRDAHLGSIWEGTSNIVALDVKRAIKREGSLPVLQEHLRGLLDDTHAIAAAYRQALVDALAGAVKLAERAAQDDGEYLVRQAATALYNCTTAIAMAWEAGKTGSQERLRLSQLVLAHRVLPRDPLNEGGVPAQWMQ